MTKITEEKQKQINDSTFDLVQEILKQKFKYRIFYDDYILEDLIIDISMKTINSIETEISNSLQKLVTGK